MVAFGVWGCFTGGGCGSLLCVFQDDLRGLGEGCGRVVGRGVACRWGFVDPVEPDGGDACEVGRADVAEGGVPDAECGAGVCACEAQGLGVVFGFCFEAS